MAGEEVKIEKAEVKIDIKKTVSQQDVIELVAHKQIQKLEAQKIEHSKNLTDVKSKLEVLDKEYLEDIKEEIKELISPFLSVLPSEHLIKITHDCHFGFLNVSFESPSKQHGNRYVQFTVQCDKLKTKKSEEYTELETRKEELFSAVQSLSQDIDNIRNDKTKIKNAITEQLLLESEEGKDLLGLVERAFDSSIGKLLQ